MLICSTSRVEDMACISRPCATTEALAVHIHNVLQVLNISDYCSARDDREAVTGAELAAESAKN